MINQQSISHDVLLEKYAKFNEATEDDIFRRVAKGIASVEGTNHEFWEHEFFGNMKRGAIGAGRIMSAAGTGISATLANCFVQPIGDCIQGTDENGNPGIYDALRQSAETMRRGGGVGYNFSQIRPKNAKVKGTQSNASGPCSYMDVFDVSCKTVESAGSRRGAQMGVLNLNHPDIIDFITAKRITGRWNNFNVSVMVPDDFFNYLENGTAWPLIHKAEPSEDQKKEGAYLRDDGQWVYDHIDPRKLWDTIMKSNYDYAEPGILFHGTINNDNNLRYCETINATNPCGEQPIPNYGCCNLGPIILPKFVRHPFTDKAKFDTEEFKLAVSIQVRFLDNVLDASLWPLPEQQAEAMNKRRIGVGFTGLGNALAMLNLHYDSQSGIDMGVFIASCMRDSAYEASIELAKERGSFPLFDADKYLESGTFASRLPINIQNKIREYGIRNSHLLSIAPTGTVSLAFADNASNGIEPPFSLAYNRKKRMADGTTQEYAVLDHGFREFVKLLPVEESTALQNAVSNFQSEYELFGERYIVVDQLTKSLVTALELSTDAHLNMVIAIAPFIDSAISKTINVPQDCAFSDFKEIYHKAWKGRIKGVSTYRPNSIVGSVLSVPVEEKIDRVNVEVRKALVIPDVDPLYVILPKRPEGDFDSVTKKIRYSAGANDQSVYISVTFTSVEGVIKGQKVEVERPLEVFIQGSLDGVPMEWVSAYSRNLSLLARSGLLAKALQDARNVKSDKGRVRYGFFEKDDGTKVPRYHESEVSCISYAIQEILIKRGLIDVAGTQIPTKSLVNNQKVFANSPFDNDVQIVKESVHVTPGKKCHECGAHAVIKKDGCDFCTNCCAIGTCG